MRALFFIFFSIGTFSTFGSVRISDTDMRNFLEGESFYEKKYSKSKHVKKINRLRKHKNYGSLRNHFQFKSNEKVCETDIIQSLRKDFGEDLVEYSLLEARRKDMVDDVVLDILLPLSRNLSESRPESSMTFQIKKGSEVISQKYRDLFKPGTCLFDNYIGLAEFLNRQVADTDENFMSWFNQWARRKRVISNEQYSLLNTMAVDFGKTQNRLRLRKYLSKRKIVLRKRKTLERSDEITQRESKKKEYGKRYRLYKSFSLSEIDFLSNYMLDMNRRILGDKAEIIFYSSEDVQEKEVISLGPTEQMRLAMKIYTRDIKILSKKELYRTKDLSFRTMLALAYEQGKVNVEDLEYLYGIPSMWDRKKSLSEKIANVVNRYGFVVPIFTGPVGTYIYFLGLSIMNTTIERKKEKENSLGDFEQDLFYGNCNLEAL